MTTMRYVRFLVLLALAPAAFAAQNVTHDFRAVRPSKGILRVQINIPAAELDVQNTIGDQIEVFGTATRAWEEASEQARAQQIVNSSGAAITVEGTRAFVKRSFGDGAQGRSSQGSQTRFTVHVRLPKGMHVEVRQLAGQVDLTGTFGDINVEMRSGDVNVVVPRREVHELEARATAGDVTTNLGTQIIEREGLFAGKTRFLNASGRSDLSVMVTVGNIDIQLVE